MLSEHPGQDNGRRRTAGADPVRTCAVSRAERPTGELIRFVAGPDGAIVPDLAARLPGRGVWITADREHVVKAVKMNAFARSLKRAVQVPADLPELVERLMERRVADALSLANKAGEVVAGFTKIEAEIGRGSLLALLHAAEAAPDGCEKLDRRFAAMADEAGRPACVATCLTIEQMSLALGRANVVHAALKEGGAARRALLEAERLRRYRSRSWPSAAPGATEPADV